ncbi:MAG: DUF393 domain-containing protein [Myxococcales bacterium]|nr:DUF393 domain-containing protein [Myxococcales bacterium]
MPNAWTGGQYSLYRAVLGLTLAARFAEGLGSGPGASLLPGALADSTAVWLVLSISAGVAALALAAGFHARVAALATACGFTAISGMANPLESPFSLAIYWLLFLQLFIPSAPYGSLAHRGAADPGGGWRLPAGIFAANWIVLALFYGFDSLTRLAEPGWRSGSGLDAWLEAAAANPGVLQAALLAAPAWLLQAGSWSWLGFELSFLPLAFWKRARPWIWIGMAGAGAIAVTFAGENSVPAGVVLLHLFAFDPAWVPARRANRPERIFYDGDCGLCHRSVRFVLAEDRPGDTFRFAPIESQTFERVVPEAARAGFPDSTAVQTADGRLLLRSAATLHVLGALGGGWRLASILAGLCPLAIRDLGYDGIAHIRSRLFRRPEAACPVVAPELRARFDD